MINIPLDLADGRRVSINPTYNVRFLFPAMVEMALLGLKRERWEPWYGDYLIQQGVTEETLLATWRAYAGYMQACLEGLDQTSPQEAITRCGFLDQPQAARLVVLAKMGQLLTASIWLPLREATYIGREPAEPGQLVKLADQVVAELLVASSMSSPSSGAPGDPVS